MRARGFRTNASFCIHRAGEIRTTRDAIESTNTDETALLKERHQLTCHISLLNAAAQVLFVGKREKKLPQKSPFEAVHFSLKIQRCVTNSLFARVFWSYTDTFTYYY